MAAPGNTAPRSTHSVRYGTLFMQACAHGAGSGLESHAGTLDIERRRESCVFEGMMNGMLMACWGRYLSDIEQVQTAQKSFTFR